VGLRSNTVKTHDLETRDQSHGRAGLRRLLSLSALPNLLTVFSKPPFTRPKRAVAFIDGRNLRYAARKAFSEPRLSDFHPALLAQEVARAEGWRLDGVHFYIGIPQEGRVVGGETRRFWEMRVSRWQREGVQVFTRDLACDNREKGVDVRLALDAVSRFRTRPYDVAMIFSQDQDFQELVTDLKLISTGQGKPMEVVSCFPAAPGDSRTRGIDNADRPVRIARKALIAALDLPGSKPPRLPRLGLPRALKAPKRMTRRLRWGVSSVVTTYALVAGALIGADATTRMSKASEDPNPQVWEGFWAQGARAMAWPLHLFTDRADARAGQPADEIQAKR